MENFVIFMDHVKYFWQDYARVIYYGGNNNMLELRMSLWKINVIYLRWHDRIRLCSWSVVGMVLTSKSQDSVETLRRVGYLQIIIWVSWVSL